MVGLLCHRAEIVKETFFAGATAQHFDGTLLQDVGQLHQFVPWCGSGRSARVVRIDPADVPIFALVDHIDAALLFVSKDHHVRMGQFHLHHSFTNRD